MLIDDGVCEHCYGAGLIFGKSFFPGHMSKKSCPNGCQTNTKSWKYYSGEVDRYNNNIKILKFTSSSEQSLLNDIVMSPQGVFGKSTTLVTAADLNMLLRAYVDTPPHGLELFKPAKKPAYPKLPDIPSALPAFYDLKNKEKALKAREKLVEIDAAFTIEMLKEAAYYDDLRQKCLENSPESISELLELSHRRHKIPSALVAPVNIDVDIFARIVLSNIEIPAFASFGIIKEKTKGSGTTYVTATEQKRIRETLIHSLCIRSAFLIAKSDIGDWFDTICVNANQKWKDPATGAQKEGIIASLQATKAEILQLQLKDLDPTACFKHLKGLSTPSVENISPVRPIFVLSTNDSRVVENKDVAEAMESEANLAAMPWEDFEHLVRQLFEWEFGKNGVEVKVTRASRDRGVDAIMYDPDPLRGGKYVLQAKRYTRTVDVAAVRDLYGTVMNEGANRGILVSTATFGPDAYDFAKDKPISLVDGPNLIAMLRRHGKNFRVNLEEARRMGTD